MNSEKSGYQRLLESESEEAIPQLSARQTRFSFRRKLLFLAIAVLTITLLAASDGIVFLGRKKLRNGRWHPQTMVPPIPKHTVAFHFEDKHMKYDEVSNRYWEELVPVKFGLIAIEDPKRFDLETGHVDPKTENLAWFGVSVFHQLHCLSAIRETIRELKTGQLAGAWGGPDHLEHCIDYIRQGLMCNADTTIEPPLYVKDGFGSDGPITGEGIQHQCRDWEAVREFGMSNGALKSFNWTTPESDRQTRWELNF